MGRLENIIARNRRPHGMREKVGFVWRGLFILFILGAIVFTDWALSGEEVPVAPVAAPPPPAKQVDGVPLMRAPAKRQP